MKKYELTEETKVLNSYTLHRIRALIDFNDVKKCDLGGFVENEENLEQSGDAWVYGSARVSGSAWVGDDARVYGSAWVGGSAWVCDDARVSRNLDYIVFKNWWSSVRYVESILEDEKKIKQLKIK